MAVNVAPAFTDADLAEATQAYEKAATEAAVVMGEYQTVLAPYQEKRKGLLFAFAAKNAAKDKLATVVAGLPSSAVPAVPSDDDV